MTAPDRRARIYAAAVLAAAVTIVAVEVLLVAGDRPLAAQVVDALLVLVLINAGPRRERREPSDPAASAIAALRALSIVPLVRVVALGLPMRHWSEPVAVLAVALPIGVVALRLMPLVGLRPRRLLSLRRDPLDLYAIGAGAVLGLVAYLAGAPALWPDGASSDRVAAAIGAALVAAGAEELVFRGVVAGALQRLAGRVGMIGAAGLFAAVYLDAGSAALVLTFALAGVVFGHVVARTGMLWSVICGHALLVAGAGALWPQLLPDGPEQLALDGAPGAIVLLLALAIAVALACREPLEPVAAARPAQAVELAEPATEEI